MTRRALKARGALCITANAAQLSLRDLRMRPLRPLPQPRPSAADESPLEAALKRYLDALA